MTVSARPAVPDDAAELLRLRVVMFESMGVDASACGWRQACLAHLREGLEDGSLIGAVVDAPDGSGLACSGLAGLSPRIPSPTNPMLPPMPWRLVTGCVMVGVVAGAVVGLVRGLDHLPTLPFAIVEGAVLLGVPASALGLLAAGCWSLVSHTRQRAK